MLRHVRHHQVYWFCRTCWQEMPAIELLPSLSVVPAILGRQFLFAQSLITAPSIASN
ncbi:MAG: hypothetical protein RML75_06425 [Cyanobacteriota bacterium SKYGB_h_bin112]|nr:hypothetical protein [Cyanobacteriota bacterium SKYGB_h_bin112]